MQLGTFHARSREFTVVLAVLTAVLVLSILLFPERAFQSSLGGLTIWWTIVFPSLLPFLMLSELLSGFGAIRGLGTLLEPATRLLFRLPGIGGWVLSVGTVGGLPLGADAASKLRLDKRVSREDGERLLALSHVASPFFMLTVLGAGFLHSPEAGAAIAIIHYAAAIGMGVLMRFLWRTPPGSLPDAPLPGTTAILKAVPMPVTSKKSILVRAMSDMHTARLEDGRSLGKLLGDSVSNAIQTLMMIGGTMIVFSVLLGVLDTAGIVGLLADAVSAAVPVLSSPADSVRSMLSGLLELHIGTNRLSASQGMPDAATAALIGAALAWSGAAVHLQVQTAVRHTDFRYVSFLLSRLLHAGLAVVLTFVLWRPLTGWLSRIQPSFLPENGADPVQPVALDAWSLWAATPYRMLDLALVLAGLAAMSIALSVLLRFRKPS